MAAKLVGSKSTITLVVEMDSSQDCEWIWDSYRAFILKSVNGKRNGVQVLAMREGNCLAALRKFEQQQVDNDFVDILVPPKKDDNG